MDWNTAFRLARHPYVDTFKYVEPDIFRFRLKEGFYIHDEENNRLDELGEICCITLVTADEEEFHEYMNNRVITEAQRVQLGLENIDEDLDELEAWWEGILALLKRVKRK